MIKKVVLALLLIGHSVIVYGDQSGTIFRDSTTKKNGYLGLDAYYLRNLIGNDLSGEGEFNLTAAGLRAGYYLERQIGVEVYGALGVGDSQELGIDMKMNSVAGILGRFESPETEDGFKLFILLGYGMAELEMQRSENSLPDRELYHSFVYGGGAEFRLGRSDSFINIQGLRHYDEEDLSLDGISLGFRQGF